MWIAIIILGLS